MKLVERAYVLRHLLLISAVIAGTVGLLIVSYQVIAASLGIAALALTITTKAMNPIRCAILDNIAAYIGIITTGYFWKHIKVGDSFTFVKHMHTDEEGIVVRIMKVVVTDKDKGDLTLQYSGDNVMFDGSPINIMKEIDRETFINIVIAYWNRIDFISWNGKSIKICL
jgi:hypothetical protein